MKQLTLLAILALCTFGASAQKIGHVDMEAIIVEMPRYTVVMDSLKIETKKARMQLLKMNNSYQKKMKVYQDSANLWSSAMVAIKGKELTDLKTNIEYFGTQRSRELDSLQGLIVNRLIEKVKVAAQSVAKAKGFTYVFNYSEQAQLVLYYEESHDLTGDVKKKMGLL